MTADPLHDLLARWPGRFRFGRLAVALRDPEGLDDAFLTDAVLRGIAEDDDEQSVFDSLLREGRLEAAEYLLENGPLSEPAHNRHRITARQHELQEELRSRFAVLKQLAEAADLPLPPELDQAELERRCAVSWPETEELLDTARMTIETGLDAGRERLSTRLAEKEAQGATDPAWAQSSRALIKEGLLRAAARQIDDGTWSPGPERVPALPAWNLEVSPERLLEWHLDPVQQQRQVRYRDWAPADDSARHLLEAYYSLSDGGFVAAQGFTTALNAFLFPDDTEETRPDEVQGGYLATVSRVFADPETARFRPRDNLDLFIGGPDTREPEGMGKVPPFAAVGPCLEPRADRGRCSVLDLRSLLQLATLRTGRSTALLRVLGPQWPLAMFAGATADELAELLGPDEGAWWMTLRWILDLTGLGGITVADALASATGWDPALLTLFLQALAERQALPAGGPGWLPRWSQHRQFTAAVEDTVLRPLGPSVGARIAFWAALSAAPAGEDVTADELMRETQYAADLVPDAAALGAAMVGLGRLRLAEEASADRVRLRQCGVLIALRDRAGQRLEEALRDWAERAEQDAPEEESQAVREWEARRYGLSPGYEEYLAALADSVPAADLDDRLARLARHTAEVAVDPQQVAGATDLVPLLREMRGLWQQALRGRQMDLSAPPKAVARISGRAAQVVLHELLANAGEALADSDGGRVSVEVEQSGEDWLVEVRDSGPGISYPEGREDLVFRAARSTRGEGRGDGLHRARRIAEAADGALVLAARSHGHPILKGAHFRLILQVG
ncbi:ATP-binding protein [Streptomyces sp. NPDC102259]|uniref:ATP-binding protein n=1 Tax=Streptomyces sp. NPDC102259 TaxID=3366148 RepID=UPI00381062F0